MTIFGKIVLGGLLLVIGGAIYYGTTSYVAHDVEPLHVASTSTEEVSTGTATNTLVLPPLDIASSTATSTTSSTTEKSTGKKIAFSAFIKKGGSYKCSVIQTVASMTMTGTVYLHDKLVRGNFVMSAQNQTVETGMILRDGYSYTWNEAAKGSGTKVKLAVPGAPRTATSTITWNGEQIGDYTCEPWVADDTVFDLPKSVTFK